jgi:hypothetical protein
MHYIMKSLILLSMLTVLTALSACTNENKAVIPNSDYARTVSGVCVDTLIIHGQRHEFLRDSGINGGGICHSPECWCYQENCPN